MRNCETCLQNYCTQSRMCVEARGYAEKICESCGIPASAGPLKRTKVSASPNPILLCKECRP